MILGGQKLTKNNQTQPVPKCKRSCTYDQSKPFVVDDQLCTCLYFICTVMHE